MPLPRDVLRDPPRDAVQRGLDPDLPICICGEQVAVPHKECLALVRGGLDAPEA